ncbi:MAG: hypothetical protein RLZZ450_5381, partial [Pseudomonadota bacterium]
MRLCTPCAQGYHNAARGLRFAVLLGWLTAIGCGNSDPAEPTLPNGASDDGAREGGSADAAASAPMDGSVESGARPVEEAAVLPDASTGELDASERDAATSAPEGGTSAPDGATAVDSSVGSSDATVALGGAADASVVDAGNALGIELAPQSNLHDESDAAML